MADSMKELLGARWIGEGDGKEKKAKGKDTANDPMRPAIEPNNSQKGPTDIMRVLEKAWGADEAGDQAKATMFFEIVAALGKVQENKAATSSPHPVQENQHAGPQAVSRIGGREDGRNRPMFSIPI
ncbi:hypothetical protein PtA15_4A489 [Puccinia triticina]|uniref:Uncharacterized protein n=1 Tax=Puccinia triticina TaxID=208348 RepID=A0ABY7CFR3_9BASI|nr:uncharacterized protein PtA15_4A489 [Puccinia triticina]WAQ84038.1 hypothetical protein PtA15_4A489 [Puccinia triticina]WAR54878.1 hypothetical protein PtB15_4B496 [Puccinia triticina]